jgi:hypothetical protein
MKVCITIEASENNASSKDKELVGISRSVRNPLSVFGAN